MARDPSRVMKLTKPQRVLFVQYVGEGHGRVRACRLVGVSYDTFLGNLRSDEDFARSIREAELLQVDDAHKILIDLFGSQNEMVRMKSAESYLARQERISAAREAKRAAREARQGDGKTTIREAMAVIAPKFLAVLMEVVPVESRARAFELVDQISRGMEVAGQLG